jgi:hypothetical protein
MKQELFVSQKQEMVAGGAKTPAGKTLLPCRLLCMLDEMSMLLRY